MHSSCSLTLTEASHEKYSTSIKYGQLTKDAVKGNYIHSEYICTSDTEFLFSKAPKACFSGDNIYCAYSWFTIKSGIYKKRSKAWIWYFNMKLHQNNVIQNLKSQWAHSGGRFCYVTPDSWLTFPLDWQCQLNERRGSYIAKATTRMGPMFYPHLALHFRARCD